MQSKHRERKPGHECVPEPDAGVIESEKPPPLKFPDRQHPLAEERQKLGQLLYKRMDLRSAVVIVQKPVQPTDQQQQSRQDKRKSEPDRNGHTQDPEKLSHNIHVNNEKE